MMRNKRRMPKLFTAAALLFALLLIGITPVLADVAEDEGVDAIAITVIVPPLPDRPAATTPTTPRVFPINVAEGYNYEGVRELVRIYELLPGESPDWINTASFTRNGYYYQIADIVRRVNVAHTVREHTEVVEIPSATNDLAGVIAGLDPTMDFTDEDGYVGVLHLDIRSIEMTQDGTRSTSRTVSQTREFPHLSNPDMALIPQTINVSGRTYSLADVDWRTNTANPIDYSSVAQTFTAFATYTRTATSTVSTGYTTTAEYSGILTRVSSGDVRFVATFIGTPIVSPIVNITAPSPDAEVVQGNAAGEENVYLETEAPTAGEPGNGNGGSNGNGDNGVINGGYDAGANISATETVQENSADEPNGSFPMWLLLLAIPLIAIIAALVFLMLLFKKKADTSEQKIRDDSANALNSRMAQIIHQDRTELAALSDDEPEDFGEGEDLSFSFDDLDSGEGDYSDEDGDEDV